MQKYGIGVNPEGTPIIWEIAGKNWDGQLNLSPVEAIPMDVSVEIASQLLANAGNQLWKRIFEVTDANKKPIMRCILLNK